jgi:hypothetical protein
VSSYAAAPWVSALYKLQVQRRANGHIQYRGGDDTTEEDDRHRLLPCRRDGEPRLVDVSHLRAVGRPRCGNATDPHRTWLRLSARVGARMLTTPVLEARRADIGEIQEIFMLRLVGSPRCRCSSVESREIRQPHVISMTTAPGVAPSANHASAEENR